MYHKLNKAPNNVCWINMGSSKWWSESVTNLLLLQTSGPLNQINFYTVGPWLANVIDSEVYKSTCYIKSIVHMRNNIMYLFQTSQYPSYLPYPYFSNVFSYKFKYIFSSIIIYRIVKHQLYADRYVQDVFEKRSCFNVLVPI